MTLTTTITLQTSEVDATLASGQAKIEKALVRSLNRGIASGRTLMVSRIAKDTGLKSKDVRDALPMSEATLSRPVARLAASLKRIPLYKFGARGPMPSRGRGRGVSYKLPGSGGRQRVENAFVAQMKTGHMGVFRRKGPGRLPIIELYGPSIGRVFAKYREEALARAEEMFEQNFGRELRFQESRG